MKSPDIFCSACGTKIINFDSPFCPKCLVRYDLIQLSEQQQPLSELRDRMGSGVDPAHMKEARSKFFHKDEVMVAAFIGSDPGLGFFKQYLIISNLRVIFWKRGITEVNKIFSFDDIGAVGEIQSIMFNGLELNIKGAKETFPYMNSADLSLAINIIRELIHVNKNKSISIVQSSIPDQIKKLAELRDSGILTEQEFVSKKTELLKRM